MIRRLIFFSASVFFSTGALSLTDPAFDRFMSTTLGNKTIVSFGSNGTALAGVRNATITKALETGGFTVGRNFALSAGGESAVQVAAKLAISRGATSRMFGVAAAAAGVSLGLPGIIALSAAPYIYDWLFANKITANPNGSLKEPWLLYNDDTGYTCRASVFSGPMSSPASTCPSAIRLAFSAHPTASSDGSIAEIDCDRTPLTPDAVCRFKWQPKGLSADYAGWYDSAASISIFTAQSTVPLSTDSVVNRLKFSGDSLEPDLIKSLIDAGATLQPDDGVLPEVSIVGDTQGTPYNVVQATKVDSTGTTTTSSDCVRSFSTFSNYVASNENCVVVTTKPDGSKTTETVKKPVTDTSVLPSVDNPSASPSPSPSPSATASSPPSNMDICKINPDILACQTLTNPASTDIPKISKTITYTPDNSFGSGSCPADKTMTVNGRQLKVVDWSSHCGYISTYLRPILILLASYMALMMLIPGRSD